MDLLQKTFKEVKNLKSEIKRGNLFRKRIYTLKEAAEVAGVSISYMQKLAASNEIPHSKPTGKLIFIKRRDLENFLMRNYMQSNHQIEEITSNYMLKLKNNS